VKNLFAMIASARLKSAMTTSAIVAVTSQIIRTTSQLMKATSWMMKTKIKTKTLKEK
jgi:hypothetical protein